MRKITLFLCIFFTIQGLHSQTLNCKINGLVSGKTPFKYAFLVETEAKKNHMAPIINGHFELQIPKENKYQLLTLFLAEDSLKTYKEAKNDRENCRLVVLEDMDIIIESDVRNAKVNGGTLNKDLDQMYQAMHSLDYELFFSQHPDSPLSIRFLRVLMVINTRPPFEGTLNCKLFYDKLSDNLKDSKEGKELLEKLNVAK